MTATFPFTRLAPVEIFAVEDTAAQLVWRGLPDGELKVVTTDGEQVIGEAGRPGAADVTGLRPDCDHVFEVSVAGRPIASLSARTEPSLPGRDPVRIATISDLHLGEDGFGLLKPIREHPAPAELHPLRCAKAAVREAVAWGAELLVIKGDITENGEPEHWELFDELLDAIPIPVLAVPGNHDTVLDTPSICATEALQARGLFPASVHSVDLGGVRVVTADSTVPRHSWGRLHDRVDDLLATIDVDRPSLLFLHHHVEPQPLPWFWPLGVRRRTGRAVLDRLVEANPDLVFSSGHTHRNRIRRHGPALVTEVGSTKDHPGVWAGYVATSSGVRQVLRRVADPSCIGWTDRTHAAVGGIWGRWSPGRLADRVVTHRWAGVRDATDEPSRLARLDR